MLTKIGNSDLFGSRDMIRCPSGSLESWIKGIECRLRIQDQQPVSFRCKTSRMTKCLVAMRIASIDGLANPTKLIEMRLLMRVDSAADFLVSLAKGD